MWKTNPSLEAVLSAIRAFSDAQPDLHGWELEAKFSESRQSLLKGGEQNRLVIYQDRAVNDLVFTLTLYAPLNDGKEMGTAKGSVDPFFDLDDQLNTLFQNAQLAGNPYFELPEPPKDDYKDAQAADPDILADLDAAHQVLMSRIDKQTQQLSGVIVNSAELFTNKHTQLLMSSKGIRAEKDTTDIYFEVAMEKAPGPNDQEVLKYWHFIGMADATLEACLTSVAQETQLTNSAQLPPSRQSAVVLIDSYAISKLAAALVSQTHGSAEYSQGPHLKAGDTIHAGERAPESDTVNIKIDPYEPQMARTSAYTDEGLIAQSSDLIVDNCVTSQIIHSRMSQYLKKPANDISGNIVVSAGTRTKDQLLEKFEEVIEILDFSSLLVNPTSLTWSSEIKLGLLHTKGQATKVLKGGITSGNVKDNFAAFQFSNQTARRNTTGGYFEAANGYVGPEHMLIWNGVTIAGQEEK
jgi:predicted Zn-dependent protease